MEMPSQDPNIRRGNLDEVAIGYTAEEAMVEAMRCTQCPKQSCLSNCPVNIDIPLFIGHVAQGEFQKAADVIKESSMLPAICGRVCPQETQCQKDCTVGKANKDVGKAVAIGRLERFIADWERENGSVKIPKVESETGKRVAIVGSGPAGLVVAADVRRKGHSVTVFEAFHKLGGVMRYGIPEFRLPNSIVDQEINVLKKMGVEFKTNYVVGRTRKLTDLIEKDGFDSVFLGTGAGLPIFLGIEGESLVGVFSANEYLTRSNLMGAFDQEHSDTPIYPANTVAVLGGGNVAMDSARMALRLGAKKVYVVYRRTEVEMPARNEEIEHAKEEGVIFKLLTNPTKFIGDENGFLTEVECIKMKLGEPDDSGRRRPIPIEGSEKKIKIDTALVAIGQSPNPLIPQTVKNLEIERWGNIKTDEEGKTSIPGLFAGGDIATGAATVILAMGAGKRAARSIDTYLKKK
ncbi:MAG: NADPH-dependent glutamate synthase [Thermoplasmatales archaeon]|nr:NADPH-dependent glutamate synthase [Thermoplasmatales archaeon]